MLKFLKKHENLSKTHLKELNKARCQRYYQRHKKEIKESRRFGSLWAYRRHQEKQVLHLEQSPKEPKEREIPSQV